MTKKLVILGSTGSIGVQVLDIVRRYPSHFSIEALVAGRNLDLLVKQAKEFKPKQVMIHDENLYASLKQELDGMIDEVGAGMDAILQVAGQKVDLVVGAITGASGIAPCHAALMTGNHLALANKEAMVCAGELLNKIASQKGVHILPMDSEHNALFQLIEGRDMNEVQSMTLTASGGPFRNFSLNKMKHASKAEALRHPNWSMGDKITIDSATMMNKGLELIEAYHLFHLPPEHLHIVVHPQSIVHGLVEWKDGAQMLSFGAPDMAAPIAHCLNWPQRLDKAVMPVDLAALGKLEFESLDETRFIAPKLAMDALKAGTAACIRLNAANEIAVDAFLNEQITFLQIMELCQTCLEQPNHHDGNLNDDVDAILDYDQQSRQYALKRLQQWVA